MKNINLLEFNEILNLSNSAIIEQINYNKNRLCLLQFKKVTRQKFKPSDLKKTKNQIAQLKTVVLTRLNQQSKN